jgi:putative redox protein
MRAKVELIDGVAFSGTTESGHTVTMDGPPDHGGRNLGPRPMEMLLLGMGSCSAFDVVHILRRGRHDVSDCRVELDAERAEREPKVFTRIHARYLVSGRDLKPEVVERAVKLSMEKYCSASIMLGKTAQITYEVEITAGG